MAAAPRRELITSESWMKWKAHTQSLRTALAAHHDHLHSSSFSSSSSSSTSSSTAHFVNVDAATTQKAHITELLGRCLDLYKASSTAGHEHSPTEAAFLWLEGWRPTSAITLIYSTLGLNESQRSTLLDHTPLAGHSDLSQQELFVSINAALLENRLPSSHPLQNPMSDDELTAMESLRRKTVDIEFHLSNELASYQMLFPDQGLAEALMTSDLEGSGYELVEAKVSQLTQLVAKAQQLRVETLESFMDLLDPIQCALCCVSAFELINALKSLP